MPIDEESMPSLASLELSNPRVMQLEDPLSMLILSSLPEESLVIRCGECDIIMVLLPSQVVR